MSNNYKSNLTNISTELESIYDTINALPDEGSGGVDTSDATAVASDIMEGQTAYVNGEKLIGTFTIDNEINSQNTLITNIKSVLEGKASATSSTLFGTYRLKSFPKYDGSSLSNNIEIDVSQFDVYLFFYDDISSYFPVTKIVATPTNFMFYGIDTFNGDIMIKMLELRGVDGETLEWVTKDSQGNIITIGYATTVQSYIDFKKPITVSTQFYNLFMTLLDLVNSYSDIEYGSPYYDGYIYGYDEGYSIGCEEGGGGEGGGLPILPIINQIDSDLLINGYITYSYSEGFAPFGEYLMYLIPDGSIIPDSLQILAQDMDTGETFSPFELAPIYNETGEKIGGILVLDFNPSLNIIFYLS